eukprot:CAMPEP_0194054538 /NCGR_PEP_ID=MMETSP0009_2-20130614/53694_1 /TAXON_ID=210454 /ORGANISM="Grammatophora oceanica, Strain CCMP 410" /LENGTH=81 /DNA_ID=CAMNT_0038703057 /DNA_START=73 /DNA_END=314 /DNA_ORIENTATION=+
MSSAVVSRFQVRGDTPVHTDRTIRFKPKRRINGFITSNAVTLIRVNLGLLKIRFTRHVLEKRAANVMTNPVEANQGTVIQA